MSRDFRAPFYTNGEVNIYPIKKSGSIQNGRFMPLPPMDRGPTMDQGRYRILDNRSEGPQDLSLRPRILNPVLATVCYTVTPLKTYASCGTQTPNKLQKNLFTSNQRIATYQAWPIGLSQKPNNLAEAGYYYTGFGDRVLCFYCGHRADNWKPNEDPLMRHINGNSECKFLIAQHGRAYIQLAKEACQRAAALTSATSSASMEKRTCKLCFDSDFDTAFWPCKHLIGCNKCCRTQKTCPICRAPIKKLERIFIG